MLFDVVFLGCGLHVRFIVCVQFGCIVPFLACCSFCLASVRATRLLSMLRLFIGCLFCWPLPCGFSGWILKLFGLFCLLYFGFSYFALNVGFVYWILCLFGLGV